MVHCHTPTGLRTGHAGFGPLLAAALFVLFAWMQQTGAFPSWRLEVSSILIHVLQVWSVNIKYTYDIVRVSPSLIRRHSKLCHWLMLL